MKRTIRVPRTIYGSVANRPPLERVIGTSLRITEGVGGAVAFIEKLIILGLMIFAGGVVLRLVGLFAAAS